jgi:carboxypeptidase PM20D1
MGATDGRYYHALTDNVYRFIPYVLGGDDLARIHGVNERVAVSDVLASVKCVHHSHPRRHHCRLTFVGLP